MNHHLPQQARRTDGTLYEPDHRFHFGLTRYCCKCDRHRSATGGGWKVKKIGKHQHWICPEHTKPA
jgi:hypothetical protein